ncbi:hypothetical protein AK812_SmicGene28310 [Symbiodinium microadriaticum]|uniref:Uncharacterized protein n=1 Tax=Symbiodinium microadriaticum TaxID=2951 RepID=A0A1Q9D4P6_SYMMI|nr:hypothetical protein AK812_SmicGene28310 [Symbiodinium microadriaticum]
MAGGLATARDGVAVWAAGLAGWATGLADDAADKMSRSGWAAGWAPVDDAPTDKMSHSAASLGFHECLETPGPTSRLLIFEAGDYGREECGAPDAPGARLALSCSQRDQSTSRRTEWVPFA